MVDFSELFFGYGFAIVSGLCLVLGLLITKKFKGSKQFIPWLLISIAFLLDFIANIGWLNELYIYGSEVDIPYPSLLDYFWIGYYSLLSMGLILYWYNINKGISKKVDFKPLIVAFTISVIVLFLSMFFYNSTGLAVDLMLDSFYIMLPILVSLSCLMLMSLFKGGKISKNFLYICIGGVTYAIAETVFVVELSTDVYYGIPTFFYMIGYILFIIGLSKVISE